MRRESIFKLHELCREEEEQMDRNQLVIIRNIKSAFPVWMSELAGAYDEDSADDTLGLWCYLDHNNFGKLCCCC